MPGPVPLELLRTSKAMAGGLTVLALDLNWWLLPEPERPVCDGITSTDDFIARLRDELDQRRAENVVVVAHHPIRSAGPHGGYTRGFWTDLGVSIFYRAYTVQDLIEPHYEEMVKVLGNVLAENEPLAMVGGHDHSLQILDGGSEARLVVVSGSASKVTGVTATEGTCSRTATGDSWCSISTARRSTSTACCSSTSSRPDAERDRCSVSGWICARTGAAREGAGVEGPAPG